MRKLELATIELVTKYPFLTDPIVLFNPNSIPTKEDILSGELNLSYPLIDKNQQILENIKSDFYCVIEIYHQTSFIDLYIKVQFGERLKDFYKVIRIIEIFHEENEYEKFNLVNEYFGIDFVLLEEVFSNTEIITDFFSESDYKLSQNKIDELSSNLLSKEQVVFYFKEALKFLGIEKNWNVKLGNVVSIIHTNFRLGGGDIIIPNHFTPRSIKDVLVLIAHEIDGHCAQFTNCDCLSGGAIRYPKSESLAEGFAMYNQYLFENNIFDYNENIISLIQKNYQKFSILNKKDDLIAYYKNAPNNGIRFFRGYKNILQYQNLKDFVYIQGLYKIIKFTKIYSNSIELAQSGAVNFSYINKFGTTKGRRKRVHIKKLSAYHILNKYFID